MQNKIKNGVILTTTLIVIILNGIRPLNAQAAYSAENSIRGVVLPESEAVLASFLAAQVADITYRAGDRFLKGSELVRFNCTRYTAEHEAITAKQKAAKVMVDSNKQLEQHNAIGGHDLAISLIENEQAIADVKASKVNVEQCVIVAPYDGQVVELLVNEHEIPEPGSPLISIINDSTFKIMLTVPSIWLNWLKVGDAFSFDVDESGNSYRSNVSRIGAVVDPVSQTVKIEAQFETRPDDIIVGMSGTATFDIQEASYGSRD